jgi:hypothetical protein
MLLVPMDRVMACNGGILHKKRGNHKGSPGFCLLFPLLMNRFRPQARAVREMTRLIRTAPETSAPDLREQGRFAVEAFICRTMHEPDATTGNRVFGE